MNAKEIQNLKEKLVDFNAEREGTAAGMATMLDWKEKNSALYIWNKSLPYVLSGYVLKTYLLPMIKTNFHITQHAEKVVLVIHS